MTPFEARLAAALEQLRQHQEQEAWRNWKGDPPSTRAQGTFYEFRAGRQQGKTQSALRACDIFIAPKRPGPGWICLHCFFANDNALTNVCGDCRKTK